MSTFSQELQVTVLLAALLASNRAQQEYNQQLILHLKWAIMFHRKDLTK
jgi:hypothetical protein